MAPMSPTDYLLKTYRAAHLIRRFEDRLAKEYRKGEMRCPVHFSTGQEAPAAMVLPHLREDDLVFANHRSHAPYLAKGGDPHALLAELKGKPSGSTDGFGGSMYLRDRSVGFVGSFPTLGDCVSLAVGSALASTLDGGDRLAVAYFGDAVLETGQFWEALNFAKLKSLPLLLICDDNGLATQTDISERQYLMGSSTLRAATGFVEVNHNLWHLDMMADRIEQARSGPVLLHFPTFRELEHVGPNTDFHLGYRTDKRRVLFGDPIGTLETELIRLLGDDHKLKSVWADTSKLLREVFDGY
jgi:TPP-dependent pyruvate/acetoin dehydrogenase alpha subunit